MRLGAVRPEGDEVISPTLEQALKYADDVKRDSSLAYASKPAHDAMMVLALGAEIRRLNHVVDEMDEMEADNARLRGLIAKRWPRVMQTARDGRELLRDLHEPCAWCNRYPCETAPGGHKDCPAFTDSGEVK